MGPAVAAITPFLPLITAGIGGLGAALQGGGQERRPFTGQQDPQRLLADLQAQTGTELEAARARRDLPITLPAIQGAENLAGFASIAGLPTGTVGIAPATVNRFAEPTVLRAALGGAAGPTAPGPAEDDDPFVNLPPEIDPLDQFIEPETPPVGRDVDEPFFGGEGMAPQQVAPQQAGAGDEQQINELILDLIQNQRLTVT